MRATASPRQRWRALGLALGLATSGLVLLDSRVTVGADGLGAEVRMKASPTGELAVASGTFLVAEDLRPGRRAVGRLVVRNQTGVTLAVTGRAEPSSPDLDGALLVRVRRGDDTVADGPLGGPAPAFDGLVLGSGEELDLAFEAWLAPDADRFEGRYVEVDIRLSAEPVVR